MTKPDADLCVIGAGSGGLAVAAGAAQLGAAVILIERGRMGGDCLNFGCVPSKALLAAAEAAHEARTAHRFGVDAQAVRVDGLRLREHIEGVIAAIAPNDSTERFEALGCRVIRSEARFVAADSVEAAGERLRARRFVIATGSVPMIPPLPGLDEASFLTNETIFDLEVVPRHLVIIGGGPIGIELAQAHRRLGAAVTVLEARRILPRDDPDLVAVVRARLLGEGVVIRERVEVIRIEHHGGEVRVVHRALDANGRHEEGATLGSHLLIATGRRPCLAALDLDRAGIAHDERGVSVDRRLRTTNRRVFAIGDAVGDVAGAGTPPRFTHVAGYHATIVIKNAVFRWPAKVDHGAVPRVTYTDPELAQVGLTEAEAAAAGHARRVLHWPMAHIDRAQAERQLDGCAKIIVGRGGRILGAGIVGRAAGELIQPWVLAMGQRLKVGALATMITPYPTRGEISSRAAAGYYAACLFSARTRRIVRLLARLG